MLARPMDIIRRKKKRRLPPALRPIAKIWLYEAIIEESPSIRRRIRPLAKASGFFAVLILAGFGLVYGTRAAFVSDAKLAGHGVSAGAWESEGRAERRSRNNEEEEEEKKEETAVGTAVVVPLGLPSEEMESDTAVPAVDGEGETPDNQEEEEGVVLEEEVSPPDNPSSDTDL